MRIIKFLCATLITLSSFNVYAQSSAEHGIYIEQSKQSKLVGEAYFSAYIAKDWDKLSSLLSDQGQFSDPTAELVFGSVKKVGKDKVMRLFRENYAPLSMKFLPSRTIFSGNYAIFEGILDWSYEQDGQTIRTIMPFITKLHIKNGKVLEHLDLADYHPYLANFPSSK